MVPKNHDISMRHAHGYLKGLFISLLNNNIEIYVCIVSLEKMPIYNGMMSYVIIVISLAPVQCH
jgi:hypothetical protein